MRGEGRFALAYEAPAPGSGSVVQNLMRIGWRVRAVDRGLEALMAQPADLWAVNLSSLERDAGSILEGLAGLQATVALLLVAQPDQLVPHREPLAALHNAWPQPLHLLVSPYTPEELLTRVGWMTEGRTRAPAPEAVHECGALLVDTGRYRVWYRNTPVPLRLREFEILRALVEANGRVLGKAELARTVRGSSDHYDDSAIKTYVFRLRAQLAAAGAAPELIGTVHGRGYFLDAAHP